ncbi:MAG TPA: hypothetical protein VFH97_02960 [Gemmatimonadales bacterium]|nr:hypothetical protein [Gemmatimonadales bacterium]
MRRAAVGGLVVVLAACGGAGGAARWEGTVTDSAGVQVVRNPAAGMWQPGQEWAVTEALRIGAAEGEPEYQFGMVVSLATLSDGRIVVLDQQGQHVKLFGADGKYQQTIGQPGAGPGELGMGTMGVFVGPGDTLIVPDVVANQRVSLYGPDGTFLASFRLGLDQGIPLRWEVTPDRRVITQVRALNLPTGPGQAPAAPDTMDAILERRLDGAPGDTLMRVPSGKTFSFAGRQPEFNFFAAEPVWAVYGDRLLYGVSDRYRLGVYSAGGRLERVIEKPSEPVPVTDADRDAMVNMLETAWRQAGLNTEQVAQLKSAIHFAPAYPAYLQAMVGPDGTVWVQHYRTLAERPKPADGAAKPVEEALSVFDMGSTTWDVFDAEGRYLGVVRMPERFQPMRFGGDRIYGVQLDELDVQYVVVLNLVKGGGGA